MIAPLSLRGQAPASRVHPRPPSCTQPATRPARLARLLGHNHAAKEPIHVRLLSCPFAAHVPRYMAYCVKKMTSSQNRKYITMILSSQDNHATAARHSSHVYR